MWFALGRQRRGLCGGRSGLGRLGREPRQALHLLLYRRRLWLLHRHGGLRQDAVARPGCHGG